VQRLASLSVRQPVGAAGQGFGELRQAPAGERRAIGNAAGREPAIAIGQDRDLAGRAFELLRGQDRALAGGARLLPCGEGRLVDQVERGGGLSPVRLDQCGLVQGRAVVHVAADLAAAVRQAREEIAMKHPVAVSITTLSIAPVLFGAMLATGACSKPAPATQPGAAASSSHALTAPGAARPPQPVPGVARKVSKTTISTSSTMPIRRRPARSRRCATSSTRT
jgi:hypothetical protein